jgi:hypothetical protein
VMLVVGGVAGVVGKSCEELHGGRCRVTWGSLGIFYIDSETLSFPKSTRRLTIKITCIAQVLEEYIPSMQTPGIDRTAFDRLGCSTSYAINRVHPNMAFIFTPR